MITAAANFELLALGPDKASAALRCILVHGTAARDAPWVQFESALSQSLMTLDPGGVRLYKFLWSGANAQVDRLSAADWLAEKLAMQAAADPEAKFLLIGHSHGGNICSNAIKGVPSPQRVGVVCLATPFLNARARSLRALRWVRAGFSILKIGAVAALLIGLSSWILKVAPWIVTMNTSVKVHIYSEPTLSRLVAIPGIILVLYYLTLVIHTHFNGTDAPEPAQEAAMQPWKRFAPTDVATLCIWHQLDEAYLGLRGIRHFGEIGHHFVAWSERYILPAMIALATLAGIFISFSMSDGRYIYGDNSATVRTGLAVLAGGLSMIIIPVALWLATAVASILTRIAVGKIRIRDHLLLDISVTRSPKISTDFVEKKPLALFESSVLQNLLLTFPVLFGPLIHSRPYLDNRTPSVIRSWYWELRRRGAIS